MMPTAGRAAAGAIDQRSLRSQQLRSSKLRLQARRARVALFKQASSLSSGRVERSLPGLALLGES